MNNDIILTSETQIKSTSGSEKWVALSDIQGEMEIALSSQFLFRYHKGHFCKIFFWQERFGLSVSISHTNTDYLLKILVDDEK